MAWGFTLLFLSCAFFLYPAATTVRAVTSSEIRSTAQPPSLASDFEATAARYRTWATEYLESQRAAAVDSEHVPLTEWPMFGSVFFLVAAEELSKERAAPFDGTTREAIDLAATVIAHPTTATWVKTKWGSAYLERENVFYRVLLLMGLSSYETLTGDRRYAPVLRAQSAGLTHELLAAPHHLADDYPGECYPNDVLWAVAAVKRASALGYGSRQDADRLARRLVAVLNGPARAPQGLPAFRVDATTAQPMQPARGSGNSGILSMVGELDTEVATEWFARYVEHYWKDGWVSGFRETPWGMDGYEDVDSGPQLFGVGSVATGLGIGAARSVGRYDYAVPLAMETVAGSWPTPFGLLLPGALGWASADGWCFGELALHFSMTRPNTAGRVVPYQGGVPAMVWVLVAIWLTFAGAFGWLGVRAVRSALVTASPAPRATPGCSRTLQRT